MRSASTLITDVEADREFGLHGGRCEEIYFLKDCRFLELDIKEER